MIPKYESQRKAHTEYKHCKAELKQRPASGMTVEQNNQAQQRCEEGGEFTKGHMGRQPAECRCASGRFISFVSDPKQTYKYRVFEFLRRAVEQQDTTKEIRKREARVEQQKPSARRPRKTEPE